MSSSKQDNLCDGSDFSDEYIILHQHFDLQVKTQKIVKNEFQELTKHVFLTSLFLAHSIYV